MLISLREITQRSHQDAKDHLRRVFDINLDPLEVKGIDPASGYPELLPLTTLKGYFGEVFAGVVAGSYPHFGYDTWHVPAYPFRFHNTAFDHLEKLRQGANVPASVFGRTGDDVLAFAVDEQGKIVRSLVCEAKCTDDHDASQVNEAHQKVSENLAKPVEIRRLIEILRDYTDPDSRRWKDALVELYMKDDGNDYERCDLVSYVCGRPPVRESTWMTRDRPNTHYKAKRRLEAVETHLQNVDDLIDAIYYYNESLGWLIRFFR